MKKWITGFLAAAASLMFAVSVSAVEKGDLLGEWHGSLLGATMTLTLYGDSSYSMALDGYAEQISRGNWELNNDQIALTSVEGADEGTFTYHEDTRSFSIQEGDMEVTFSRAPVIVFSPADARTDAALADYQGFWQSGMVTVMGMTVNGTEAGFDLMAEVTGEAVRFRSDYLVLQGELMAASFENGALHITLKALKNALRQPGTAAPAAAPETEDGAVITMQLLQDNTMAVHLSVSGVDMIYYMTRTTVLQ